MLPMRLRRFLLVTLSAGLPLLSAGADAPFATIAQSAQVLVEGTPAADGLTVRLKRTTGGTALPVSELTASLAGRAVPVTRQTDGTFRLKVAPSAGPLELIVAHDGIRELLSSSAPAGAASGAAPPVHAAEHKQLWWWILNIAIVLIAVLAISRRMS
jgi:hypothetical protein